MNASEGTVLSIAVASGKMGYVFLIDGDLCQWGVVTKASQSAERAIAKLDHWLNYFSPDLVIMEQLTGQTRKSGQAVENIRAIAQHLEAIDQAIRLVERASQHPNKYAQMITLAERYPTAKAWLVPPRKLWEAEHKHTVIWEALSLVHQVQA